MSASHILTNGDVCQKWWDIWFKLRFEDTRVRLSWFLPTSDTYHLGDYFSNLVP